MSTQLHSFFQSVLSMPHYSNQYAGSGVKINSHEDAIELELTKAGFFAFDQHTVKQSKKGNNSKVKTFPKLSRKALAVATVAANRQQELLKLVPGMPCGTYISQPISSQSFPDFLIRDFTGTIYLVEAKSMAKGGTPVMNDNTPKEHCIYIISSGEYNQATILFGEDLILPAHAKMFEDFHVRQQIEAKLFNEELAKLGSTFEYYVRPKFQQRQGRTTKGDCRIEKVNCFKHNDRKNRENKVLLVAGDSDSHSVSEACLNAVKS